MRIFVCIKEVPDTTDVKIDSETGTLIRAGVPSILNPFDMSALEEALQLKDKNPSVKVTVICMGPPQTEKNLRETLAMGADDVYLLTDREFAGADTWATSYTISTAIKYLGGADIIFAGKQAIDGDTAQTGPGIAEWLDIPQITFVRKVRKVKDGKIVAERSRDFGYDLVEAELPVLVTIIKGEKAPRLPSLRGMLKAKRTEIKKLNADDIKAKKENIGLNGSPTRVHRIFTPPKRASGEKYEGESSELAEKCAEIIKSLNIV